MKFRFTQLLGAFLFSSVLLGNDTLNPCVKAQAFHIVVLGSSTAAGTGPSSSDSTWVNRYRTYLQGINPSNQVTNLAQGGTTTYQIMPDWFTQPAGRPAPNPARNVSQAISLQADAIIVNMPSNDAANNFTVTEQLFNFRTIVASADSAGIPVWVCTTQPRNFSTSQIQMQMDVRDSILSIFGIKAIDFWTTIADTTGRIDSIYNSGDNVHLNDRAHRLLFHRVSVKNLLTAVIDTNGGEDHTVYDLTAISSICGGPTDTIWVSVSNLGRGSSYNLPLRWWVKNITNSSLSIRYDTIRGGMKSCETRSLYMLLNTAQGGQWEIGARIFTSNDTITSNDSTFIQLKTLGLPQITASPDTVCFGQTASLTASGADTTLWYDSQGSLVAFGSNLSVSNLQSDQQYRASVIRGPLYFVENLRTTELSNINFSGIMFDLIANDTLHVDSLSLKVRTIGKWEVTVHRKSGSHKGFEMTPAAWTLWGKDSVDIPVASSWDRLNLPALQLVPGDTVGVYLDMQTGSQLEYNRSNNEIVFSDPQLSVATGTGVTHSFGTTYFPRLWNGIVHYHHGFNPTGYCSLDTMLSATISPYKIDLGGDTTLYYGQSIQYQLPSTFSNIFWSTGDTTAQIMLDSSQFSGAGPHLIYVSAMDPFGCVSWDSLYLSFTDGIGLEEYQDLSRLEAYPNPSNGQVWIEWAGDQSIDVYIQDLRGQSITSLRLAPGKTLCELSLSPGVYLLSPRQASSQPPLKLSIQ